MPTQLIIFQTAVVLVASTIAAVTDVWRFKVYNLLTFPLLVSGVVFHAVTEGKAGISDSILGVLIGFGLLLYPYMLGAMGAGDVKFVAAVGAWLGMEPMFPVIVIGCLAAGVYSVAVMMIHNGYRQTWIHIQIALLRLTMIGRQLGADDEVETVQEMVTTEDRRKRLVPFSAMISVGIVTIYLWQLFGDPV